MDQIFDRYRTIALLGLLLVVQLLLLAWQVRRPDNGGVRLLRVWSIEAIVPVEKGSQWVLGGIRNFFSSYVALSQAEQENRSLHQQLDQLQLANQQLRDQARSLPGLDALLAFQQNYINHTLAAQVIGSGATTNVQVIYLNRGRQDGIRRNMAVISPEGVVGKVTQVFAGTAEVLLITDPDSGVGAMIEQSRVHGVLQGLGTDQTELKLIINDQKVQTGDQIVTSGEDQVYPRGLPLGTVVSARQGSMFQKIIVQPAAHLSQLEEVLVVTAMGHQVPVQTQPDSMTAAQLRQQQLPSIPANSLVPRTGLPPTMAEIMDQRRRAAIAAAQAASALQQGLTPPGAPATTPTATTTPAQPGSRPAANSHPTTTLHSPAGAHPKSATTPLSVPPPAASPPA